MNEQEAVDWVIKNFPEGVENYKKFPESWFGYLFGQVMKNAGMQTLEDKKNEVIKGWGNMMIGLNDNDPMRFRAAAVEADVIAMLSAANVYIELRDSLSPMSTEMIDYLDKAAEIFRSKATALLNDEIFKKLGIK